MKILNENFIEKRDEIIRTKILAEVKKKKKTKFNANSGD